MIVFVGFQFESFFPLQLGSFLTFQLFSGVFVRGVLSFGSMGFSLDLLPLALWDSLTLRLWVPKG